MNFTIDLFVYFYFLLERLLLKVSLITFLWVLKEYEVECEMDEKMSVEHPVRGHFFIHLDYF